MKSRIVHKPDGQTLVQVAILLTVLLAFLALAVDIGWMYAGRRQMQNAADAGALAGAWEICFGNLANAEATALQYAVSRNGAQTADVTIINNKVNVIAEQTVDLFVADVIGLGTVDVGAEAEAACGGAVSACGLWPVTLDLEKWNEIINKPDPDTGFPRQCAADPFYVWTGDNENQNPDCTVYDCDVDDDGLPEVVGIIERGWVDFSDVVDPDVETCASSGCGESEMECWVRDDSSEEVIVGDCMPGLSGVKAGVKDGVDFREGDHVSIPIYDGFNECTSARSCPGGNRYTIAGFGCIEVIGWVHELVLPRLDGANPPWKDKAIKAAVNCPGCVSFCGFTTGDPPVPGGVNAVSLIK